jgi:hypothetical protein
MMCVCDPIILCCPKQLCNCLCDLLGLNGLQSHCAWSTCTAASADVVTVFSTLLLVGVLASMQVGSHVAVQVFD